MKTNNIIHWTIKIGWEDGTEEYIADIPDWVAKPVDEFLGEIEKEKREEQPEPVLATRHSDNEVIDVGLTEDIAFEEGFKQGKLAQKKDDELPDGLQKYIDGVALNILYSNYHKSTNGIWSRAEVDDHWEKDGDVPEVWEVIIDFGCQDDTRNESYRDKIYVFKKDDEWTCDEYNPIDAEDYDWLEEHDAMERHKDNL